MAASVEDVCNQALVEIGFPERIGSIEEGTAAATAALEIYSQTRDEILDEAGWPLARRANIPLLLLKGPPPAGGYNPAEPWSAVYPPPGYLYEYLYPADCITLRAIVPRPSVMFVLDPKPAVWREDNDNSLLDRNGAVARQQKVILTNVKDALAVYTGQVIDPSLWEAGFTSSLVKRLAQKLARRLKSGEAVEREEAAEGAATVSRAAQDRG